MPQRKIVLATNEIYHVFNRSIAKAPVFSTKWHLNKVLEIVEFYQYPQALRLSKLRTLPPETKKEYIIAYRNKKPLVEIYSFAFMPNHYHFLLKQFSDNGVSRFISNVQNSFAKIYNLKNDRNGALFQNSFKAKRIETDEQFLHVSRYIHLNPVTSYIIELKDLETYPYASFPCYSGENSSLIVNTEVILGLIGSKENYTRFVFDQADYQRELVLIKDLAIE